MKSNFGVWSVFIWRRIAHVLIVMASVAPVDAMEINIPSSIEVIPTIPWDGSPELSNGYFQFWEYGNKNSVNFISAAGPVDRSWVQTFEEVMNGNTELVTGLYSPLLQNGSIAKVSSNSSSKNHEKDFFDFHLIITLCVVVFLAGVLPVLIT